ncbi:MAG: acetylornithine transaminase [Gemmatimonadetes bacterium]|nr:acetylornithine transaminase [Gemmatimonadota bacterium]MCC6769604.1 acetylornithine transaminase [Gemmatimonadaceae bacterium]
MPAIAATPVTPSLLPTYKRAPMEFVRGEGVELIDADGKRYIDFTSGIAVNALGYGDAGLQEAIRHAAEGLIHVSNLYRTAPGEQLADKFVATSFADRVFFCNSGAEANEGAFKFARRWARGIGGPAKHEIFSLRGAFHGRLFGTVAATDRPQYRMPFRPLAGGISILERDLDDLVISVNAETTAAVILEPIQGEGGVRVLEPAFVQAVRELTRARNVALIFDEIQCGMGRTGHLYAYERLGVAPDILTLAKPIAAGLPMGAILMTEEIGAAIQAGDHGTTFGGGPFVASVALHVFDRLSDPALLAHVREMGTWFSDQLHGMSQRTGRIRAIRGAGLMWGFDVVEPAADIIGRARDAGLLLVSAGEHTIRILPPLVATRDDLARGLVILEGALAVG